MKTFSGFSFALLAGVYLVVSSTTVSAFAQSGAGDSALAQTGGGDSVFAHTGGAAPPSDVVVDWARGVWRFDEAAPGKRSARMTFAGDWYPARTYDDLLQAEPEALYGEMLPLLRASDVTLVNVETTIGTRGEPILKGGPTFQLDPSAVRGLTAVPFDVALLANNHSADYGPESVEETIDRLQQAGLRTVGSGMTHEDASKPLILNVGEATVAVINIAEGEEGRSVNGGPGVYGLDVPLQEQQIRALRPNVDLVIINFHGGREHLPSPPPYVVHALRALVRAGADAVIAHHPHVPQSIEVVDGAPIVYSQGNFVFWQADRYYRQVGYLVSLDIAGRRLVGMEITPYQQRPDGLVHLAEPHRTELLRDLETLSERLSEDGGGEALWNAFVDHVNGGVHQLSSLVEGLEDGNTRSAVLLRNIFFTEAHRQMIITGMDRLKTDRLGTSPEWAQQMVRKWLNRPSSELPRSTPSTTEAADDR